MPYFKISRLFIIKNKVFNINKEGLELVKETAKITKFKYPVELEKIYNNKLNKIIWDKEQMEENLIKMIGELDESC